MLKIQMINLIKIKIEKKYNNVKVILSGKNLGYGAANNLRT